ncbi:MAG: hypothetical protein BGO67_11460 [Alphaproteobacteria bacterium 41-28]|nr:MAG: hypothetical protein BGO67_11460 [Alphaproteobacteria bacterium 41-28]
MKIILLSIFLLIYLSNSAYTHWDEIKENLSEKGLVRAFDSKKKFSEQDRFNLYFSYKTSLYWGETEIPEENRDYLLNLAEQLTPGAKSLNHLFVKIFCIYTDSDDIQHYADSLVMAKFHGFNKKPGVSHYIGLHVTTNDYFQTKGKRLIDFSSGTSAWNMRNTSINDEDIQVFIHSGKKTTFPGHSEDRFFKLESISKDFNEDGEKYNNSIFEQLISKKCNKDELQSIKCLGVKFFSRYDACSKCQSKIMTQLSSEGGLYKDFMKSLKAMELDYYIGDETSFIPIYYSGRGYTNMKYSYFDTGEKWTYKNLVLNSVKRTSSIFFTRTKTNDEVRRVFPTQSFETAPNKIDLSEDYLKGCMFSNIRTLYTE